MNRKTSRISRTKGTSMIRDSTPVERLLQDDGVLRTEEANMSREVSRRSWLKFGTAGAAGAALYRGLRTLLVRPGFDLASFVAGAAMYKELVTSGVLSGSGNPQAVDAGRLDEVHESLGRWIYLTPQKLGGGTHAVDLSTGKTLAWISYWNYGDTCPISHHLAAYPSDDPYKGFEFVNSTQGGDNVLIYGIPTRIKQMGLLDRHGQGKHSCRVRDDGQQITRVDDVSASTCIGLGVHTVIYPDANGFACADGQKDVCAFFDRAKGAEKTKVLMAFRADWSTRNKDSLERCW